MLIFRKLLLREQDLFVVSFSRFISRQVLRELESFVLPTTLELSLTLGNR